MLKNFHPGFVSSQSSRNLQTAVFSPLLPSRLSFRPSGCLTTWGGSRATALPWHSSETRCWSSSETTSATTGTTSYPDLARCRTSDPCPWCVGLFYLKSHPETCLSRVNHLFVTSFFPPGCLSLSLRCWIRCSLTAASKSSPHKRSECCDGFVLKKITLCMTPVRAEVLLSLFLLSHPFCVELLNLCKEFKKTKCISKLRACTAV